MTTQTTQTPTATAYDPAALCEAWTAAADDTRWRYRDTTIGEFYAARDRAAAWDDGAAHVHIVGDIAAHLTERIQSEDTSTAGRRTYVAMLNDIHTARTAGMPPAAIARLNALEAEVAALRAQLAA